MSDLTAKQEAFVREYLVDTNATQAAIRAGYSAKTAETQGSRLYRNVQVAAAIQKGLDRLAKKAGLTAEKVLGDIERISASAEATEDWNAALKGKELLGKHLKLFTDKVEATGEGGAPLAFVINLGAGK